MKIVIFLLGVGLIVGAYMLSDDAGMLNRGRDLIVDEVEREEEVEKKTDVEKEVVKDEILPIEGFDERISKKSFGDYISPANSPVSPERFEGFHTGVDVEYEDVEDEVEVYAVAEGEVVKSGWVSGYGGVVILKSNLEGSDYYFLYGHLDPDSLHALGKLSKGEKLGVLGKGYSRESDGERKHLHFSVRKNSMSLEGYVQREAELNDWINPLSKELWQLLSEK